MSHFASSQVQGTSFRADPRVKSSLPHVTQTQPKPAATALVLDHEFTEEPRVRTWVSPRTPRTLTHLKNTAHYSSLVLLLQWKFHSSVCNIFLANLGACRSPFFKTSWAKNVVFHSAVSLASSLTHLSSNHSPVSRIDLLFDRGTATAERCHCNSSIPLVQVPITGFSWH